MSFTRLRTAALGLALSIAGAALADPPQYQIYDIGLVQAGDAGSQGFRVSNNGVVTGRSLRSGSSSAYSWTVAGGLQTMSNLASPSRPYSVGNGVNDSGVVVGTGATTAFGSSRLPIMWQGGVATQLGLPSGQTLGDANDVNSFNIAVGSVGSGVTQFGAIYQGGTGSIISTTTSNGSYLRTAFSINDSVLIVGQGIDPNNAAVNVGIVYDMNSNTAYSVGALSGRNGALAFDVSNAGHVVGSTMLNQGSGTPFIWTQLGGMVEIALPSGTSSGSARGVNSSGWAVGTASSAFAIPFLYDGSNTYRIADLVDPSSGWDLSTNTSSSAMSISDSGIIVGTGVFNGSVHAYALVPVPEPASMSAMALGVLALIRRRKRQS